MSDATRTLILGLITLGTTGHAALANGDATAGAELATQCAACHGPAGISTANDYPNLAAQKPDYISSQLLSFRTGERKNALMNAVAAGLSDTNIDDLAAHFASLPGAPSGEANAPVAGLDGSLPMFPADYASSFTRYQRIDFPDRKQVRYYWANDSALATAEAGENFDEDAYLLVEIFGAQLDDTDIPVVGDDGLLIETELAAFTAMQKGSGWGDEVPDILRNSDWRYAVFSSEGVNKEGVNEAPCLACHKPLTEMDYSFTYEALQAHAKAD